MKLTRKHVIIYNDWTVWQSDVDAHAMDKMDTDSNIISALTRDKKTKEYYSVFVKETVNEPYLNIINN